MHHPVQATQNRPPAAQVNIAASAADTEHLLQWYVAYTEARQEHVALINLERQGFQTYLPRYKMLKKKVSGQGDAGTDTYEPMFPRYMFFKPSHAQQSISTVRSTRGVTSVVRFGNHFAQVSTDIIQAIQEHEHRRNITRLDASSRLRPGLRIRIDTPALSGLEGLVHAVSTQRITVLMEILGRQTRVKVRPDIVEPL